MAAKLFFLNNALPSRASAQPAQHLSEHVFPLWMRQESGALCEGLGARVHPPSTATLIALFG